MIFIGPNFRIMTLRIIKVNKKEELFAIIKQTVLLFYDL